jgi:heme/copper-type cytochrome/quinol oxidase subunit 4
MEKNVTKSSGELRRGVIVFIALAVLTVIEYFLGIWEVANILLWIVALIKAALVIWFFMHVFRLFGGESEAH